MTLAQKYGIQSNTKVESINLNQNPYTYEGTFKEFYGLVASGKVKTLKQNDIVCGISVGGYDTIEADNLAGKAFAEAYEPYQAMIYMNLATQLVEANLIPTIVSENPLTITILNGLVTLNQYGEEIDPEPEDDEDVTDDDIYEVPGNVVGNLKNIKNYIRYTEGYCLARGCNPSFRYNNEKDVYEVTGIEWGRKLTEAEKEQIEYDVE